MSKDEQAIALRDHARRWAKAGPELARLRYEVLRAQSAESHRAAVIEVLSGPPEWFVGGRPDSGLIEQQRIFKRLWKS